MAGTRIMDVVRMMEPRKATLEQLRSAMEREGHHCETVTDTPGTRYEMHRHPFDDFVVIVSGKMKLGTPEQTWLMEPGSRIDIPANTSHWAEVVGKKPVCYLTSAD